MSRRTLSAGPLRISAPTSTAALAAFAVALAGAVTSCSRALTPYFVGTAGPQALGFGVQNQRGIELAIDEINRAGGVQGHPLRLVVADDRGTGADAARVASGFVDNHDILAVIGHVTSASEMSAARVYDHGKLAAVATTPSSPDLTGISPWVFRMITSDSANGVTLARFATALADSLHRPVRAAVLYHNDAYGRGLADAFLHTFRGVVINTDPIGNETNLEPYVAYFRDRRPDIVFVASDEELGLRFLREAHRQRLAAVFLGGDGWQGITTDSAAEGAYVGTPFTSEGGVGTAQHFVDAYRARYHLTPDAQSALAYDAAQVIAHAIGRAADHGRVTRATVREALAGLSRGDAISGASGPVWFASNNDRLGEQFRVARVRDGVLLPVGAP